MAFSEGTSSAFNPENLSGEHDEKKQGPMTAEQKAMQPPASQVLGERGMAAMQGIEDGPVGGEEEDPETTQTRSTVNELVDAIKNL
ncbi:hypothetical protein KC573_04260 [candidate division WWE3 bacterium]|uniref:Uncharacterized protein n=1 Tax=candidate division WWE3 bacterium TaxID=2053526 RepID=A0A955LWU2_UNCKA|nr:hypothetical protein [candidate division WWE3 bacterium]